MKLEEGVLTLHQSDISHYMKCPEQFRVVNGLHPGAVWEPVDGGRIETDAATVGTVLHAVIEEDLNTRFVRVRDAIKFGMDYFHQLLGEYLESGVEYRTESFGADPSKPMAQIKFLIENWFRSDERRYWMSRNPDGYETEWSFDIPFVTFDNPNVIREVRLAGQADVLDLDGNRILDWKSASRAYQRWEKQRWEVQPTVYTYAGVHENKIKLNKGGFAQFDYRVFVRGQNNDCQELTVWRGNGQWGWLVTLVDNIVKVMESDAEMWPLRDDHALCGPKWCPVWSSCKGLFVDEEWR